MVSFFFSFVSFWERGGGGGERMHRLDDKMVSALTSVGHGRSHGFKPWLS